MDQDEDERGPPKERIYFGSLEKKAPAAAREQSRADLMDVETLPFSEATIKTQERHHVLLGQLEQKKRARAIAVPTSDLAVKAMLRERGEPIILFGEQPPERRERLRQLLAATEGEVSAGPSRPATAAKKQDQASQLYYTEGSADLRNARRWIAGYSLPRAGARLEQAKKRREVANFESEFQAFCVLRDRLKRFSNSYSQIGDERPLSYCCLSPDSSLLLTGSWSGVCKLWNMSNYQEVATLKAHTGRVGAVIFHPNACVAQSSESLNFASAAADKVIKLWALNSNTPLAMMSGHTDRIGRIAFHPSGRFLGSTSFDKTWRLWDLETNKELLVQHGHSQAPYAISFQCDGSLVATSGLDAYGRVWDLRTGKSVMVLRGHAKQMLAIDFSPSGYEIATGSEDNFAKIWDLRRKKCVYSLPAHGQLVSHVKYQPEEGSFLLTSSFDGTSRLWSTRDWSPIQLLKGHEGKVLCADISLGSRFIVSASYDRTWKIFTHEEAQS